MPEEITLFDLPTKGPHVKAWSLNPWKTRLLLNYKNIPYKTIWLEYPDIEPTLSPHLPPNTTPGSTPYTIPTIILPDGTYLMDSHPISLKLEELYPTPALSVASPVTTEISNILPKIALPLRGTWLPKVNSNLLGEKSRPYFERTRKERVGMGLEEYAEREGGGKGWEEAERGIVELGRVLKRKGEEEGPFVEGERVTYADFIIVSFLHFHRCIDKEALFDKMVALEPALGRLYNACEQWLVRDDY